ncbi:peptidoglycan-binding protein [Azonexus hydrophilus]|uniref:Peptidoglycan-binding protein n=1 Tax=Azonexus hydrophilus TaxID=418702 RepID=A0A1R1IBT7_9RHOO|nr:LysM peptidoglycan-binding domain-containing protein [Azonexus hydrophilus]OMG56142.1 peptidoglycan-binding protein [Azonexus hydrophilus]
MVRIISALILAVTAACATAAEPLELVSNPPDRHIVVKGDTLWDISGKFLKKPWRWPEIWRMNKDQIKNPHLIYPGDIVWLDMSDGSPRLRLGKPVNNRIQPQAYATAIQQVIPSIPPNVIEPFISQPLIVEDGAEKSAARIVATQEDRVLLGSGDTAYVSGITDASVEKWHVFRPGKPLKDPETDAIVAYEAFFLGNAQLVRPGEPASLRITLAKEEIARGDWLRPAPPPTIMAYVPRQPEQEINARIMSIYGAVSEGGASSVITLNRGAANNVEVGHVLALYRKRTAVHLDDDIKRETTVIPDERYGLAFVFRTFENVAYALVIDASKSVLIGDLVRNP